eukprot:tig00000788_g4089.t1
MAAPAPSCSSLDCALCLEQLRQPSTLSCNHTFCRDCILALPGVGVPREVPVNPVIQEILEQLAQLEAEQGNGAADHEIPASEVVRSAEIGRGATGMVFAGTWGERPVALKVIDAAALGAAGEREAAARRLLREAAILSMVRHPGVVQLYGVVNEAGGGATLVTERAETSLRALLAERRLSLAECLDLGVQVLGALAHLHARNIVHRDVKPGNVLVFRGEGGRLQYKLSGAVSTGAAAMGTVAYAAPEALRGEGPADFAGDVYGAAVVLNEALAGRLPFPGVHPFQVMQRVAAGQRPEPATEGVPAAVQALVQRMWAGEAAARPSAAEARRALAAAVEALQASHPLNIPSFPPPAPRPPPPRYPPPTRSPILPPPPAPPLPPPTRSPIPLPSYPRYPPLVTPPPPSSPPLICSPRSSPPPTPPSSPPLSTFPPHFHSNRPLLSQPPLPPLPPAPPPPTPVQGGTLDELVLEAPAGPAPPSIPARFARDGRPRLEGVALPASPIGAYGALLLARRPAEHLLGAAVAVRCAPLAPFAVGRPYRLRVDPAAAPGLVVPPRAWSGPSPSPLAITLRLDAGGDGAAAGRVGAPAAGLRLRGPCGAALDSDRDVWALRDGDLVSC